MTMNTSYKYLMIFTYIYVISSIFISIFALAIFLLYADLNERDINFPYYIATIILYVSPVSSLFFVDRLKETRFLNSLIFRKSAITGLLFGVVMGVALFVCTIFLAYILRQFIILSYNYVFPSTYLAVLLFGNSITEEVVFRGMLFNAIEREKNTSTAIIVSSGVFGCLHYFSGGFVTVIAATTLGLFMCLLYSIFRNLWLTIGFHWIWDFLLMECMSRLPYDLPSKGIVNISTSNGFSLTCIVVLFVVTASTYLFEIRRRKQADTFHKKQAM